MLAYGTSAHQGPRDGMEDFLAVVPKARCGFLYAGIPLDEQCQACEHV